MSSDTGAAPSPGIALEKKVSSIYCSWDDKQEMNKKLHKKEPKFYASVRKGMANTKNSLEYT